MPLFGDRRDQGPRSAAEREAARLERERRRALREGREPPAAPLDDGTGDGPADEQPPFEWDAPGDGGGALYDAEGGAPREPAREVAPEWDDEALRSEDRRGRDVAPETREPEPEPEPQPTAARHEPGGDSALDPRAQAWQQRRPAADDRPAPWREDEPDAEPDDEPGAWDEAEAPGTERDAARDDDRAAWREDGPAAAGDDEPDPWRDGPAARHDDEPVAWDDDEPAAEREERDAWRADDPAPVENGHAGAIRASRRDEPARGAGDDAEIAGAGAAGAAAGAAADESRGGGDVANGRHAPEEPQATQPFDAVTDEPAPRRTLSFPRPQTDTGEWDAPIGTVRRSRGGGDGGGGYRAQPGAPGYPPYRKLEVKGRRRWLRRIVVILALGLAIAAAAFAFLLFQPKHSSGHGQVVVTVPAGATADEIGDLLAKQGVVRSGFLFSLRARLSGDRSRLRSGRHRLKEGMSYAAALTALTTAPKAAPTIDITIPEGPSRREEAPKLRAAGIKGSYLQATRRSSKLDPRDYGAARSVHSLEGFLYPDTYELRQSDATARRLVGRQLDAFKANFAKVSMTRAKRRNLSRYDVLIIASMIEREAQVPRDRRLIAAVIYNRLKQDMPLGIDATLRYALNQWSRPLRVSELNRDSAFNTRRHTGLPPTPIGNPGLAAMRAAANPANAPYLFYVVKPCGNGAHAFSSTDAQFERDVARYNAERAKAGGKSPTTC